MTNLSKVAKKIRDKITITVSTGREQVDQAKIDESTKKMLEFIDNDQKPANILKQQLQKLSKNVLTAKHSTLLDELHQYTSKDSVDVNAANEILYTFILQPNFAFLETLIAPRLAKISEQFDYKNKTYTVTCKIESN